MAFSIDKSGTKIVLKLQGEVDMFNAYDIMKNVRENLESKNSGLIIDLSGVSYIDSSGMGMIMKIKKLIDERKSSLNIKNIPDDIIRVFKIVSLDKLLEDHIEK